MTKQEYQEIARVSFVLPQGNYAEVLFSSLADLGSPDPELRDDLAFSAFWTWILQGRVDAVNLREVLKELLSDNFLFFRISDACETTAVRRTFSALLVSTILEHDNSTNFLTAEELTSVLGQVTRYLEQETCLVGHSPSTGWVHAIAHGADVFRELMKSTKVSRTQRAEISHTVLRLLARFDQVLGYGEEERLCQAVFCLHLTDPELLGRHVELLQQALDTEQGRTLIATRNLCQYAKTFVAMSLLAGREDLARACASSLKRVLPVRWAGAD